MNEPRSKWPDERLDDLARQVQQQARHSEQLARMDVELMELKEDVRAIDKKTDGIIQSLAAQAASDKLAKREEKAERKKDRWAFAATALTVAGLLLTAAGLFGDKL